MGQQRYTINGLEVVAHYPDALVQDVFKPLLRQLTESQRASRRRLLVLLAGPPGVGKSTLAHFLSDLSDRQPDCEKVQAIGLDGFHFPQAYLECHSFLEAGQEIPLAQIKGAPPTFDLSALLEKVRALQFQEKVLWPEYDRTLHDPVADRILVESSIVILEGNYLLLNRPGWRELYHAADYTIQIKASPEKLFRRLVDRKVQGKACTREEAEKFVSASDVKNIKICMQESYKADLTLQLIENEVLEVCC